MDSRTKRRIDRIHKDISILVLLERLGYKVRPDMDREQQFPCDLHGDGQDGIPSARVYRDNSWYCFACQKVRDHVSTVREKKGLGFIEALTWLEKEFHLPVMPWEDGDQQYVKEAPLSDQVVKLTLDPAMTYADDDRLMKSLIDSLTHDRDLPLDTLLAFWEGYDKVHWMVQGKEPILTEAQGRQALAKLKIRLMDRLRAAS